MTAHDAVLASGGYLIVLHGFLASFKLVPLNGGLDIGSVSEAMTGRDVRLFLAALQIAGPILAVLFLADIGARPAEPGRAAAQRLLAGFPLKILHHAGLVGAALW